MTSYYLRFTFAFLFICATLYSFLKRPKGSWSVPHDQRFRLATTTLFALVGLLIGTLTFSGAFYTANNTVSLNFPFAQGRYCVIQGGSNMMTNPFHRVSSNGKYAVDIVKINNMGNRATSVIPSKLTQYHIFGDAVCSPCEGRIIKAVDGLPDNKPGSVDRVHSSGNHIIIDCSNTRVMLAHLKEGSLKVTGKDYVQEEQKIAEVGNSGYTDEPHLHIQANTQEGTPVAIMFDGRFLSINDLYVVK